MEAFFWLVLFILFLIFEIATLGLTTIWFAGGAFIAFWMSVAEIGFVPQLIVFLVVSVILLVTTRPIATKYLNKNTTRTNVEELIGKTVKVSETIDNINETGHVLINGVEWLARAQHEGMVIQQDTLVKIMEIQGVKVMVQPLSIVNGPLQDKKENV
ncbi:MAG: NfeD family protein [Lachnospiraceae bacterium]|nr:NfeD family protein [Lachnospiraceae bacterium]